MTTDIVSGGDSGAPSRGPRALAPVVPQAPGVEPGADALVSSHTGIDTGIHRSRIGIDFAPFPLRQL